MLSIEVVGVVVVTNGAVGRRMVGANVGVGGGSVCVLFLYPCFGDEGGASRDFLVEHGTSFVQCLFGSSDEDNWLGEWVVIVTVSFRIRFCCVSCWLWFRWWLLVGRLL